MSISMREDGRGSFVLGDGFSDEAPAGAFARRSKVEDRYQPDVDAFANDGSHDQRRVFLDSIEAGATIELNLACTDGRRERIQLNAHESAAYAKAPLDERLATGNRKIRERRYTVAKKAAERLLERNAAPSRHTLSPEEEACLREFGALVGSKKNLALRESTREKLREDGGFFDGWGTDSMAYGQSIAPSQREYLPMGGPAGQQQNLSDIWNTLALTYYAWANDPLAHRGCEVIADFTLGRGVGIVAKHPAVQRVIDEFFEREQINARLHTTGVSLSRDGELFARKMPLGDGRLKVRMIPPASIWEIVTDGDDVSNVYSYVQRYQCLDGDTKIPLLDGTEITIRDMAEKHAVTGQHFDVYSFDLKANRVVPGNASRAIKSGEKRCVEVLLDNGERVIASYDHPFLCRDGVYRWAEALEPGRSLMPLYRRKGYEQIWQPDTGWNYTHREFAKQAGLDLSKGRAIDHINGTSTDNRPTNLQSLTHGEHSRKTWAQLGASARRVEGYAKGTLKLSPQRRSEAMHKFWLASGDARRSPEALARLSSSVKNAWSNTSPEARVRRANALKATWQKRTPEQRAELSEKCRVFWAAKTPEEMAARSAKIAATKASKSPEERAASNLRISQSRTRLFEPGVVNHKVVSVTPAGFRDVYDLTVDEFENFAVSAGVFVHNTRQQTFAIDEPLAQVRWIERTLLANEVLHIKINASETDVRGRSDIFSALGWLKRLRDYFDAVVQREYAAAAYQFHYKVDGGAADVARIATAVSGPRPVPGQGMVTNKQVDIQAISSGHSGGGGEDGTYSGLVNHIALAFGLSKDYFGAASRNNRASALIATEPSAKRFEDRQNVIEAYLKELLGAVVDEARKYGRLTALADEESDIDEGFRIIFPTIIKADAQTRLTMLRQLEGMGWISARRAAQEGAGEVELSEYDYDDEVAAITEETGEDPRTWIMRDVASVKRGLPALTDPAFAGETPNPADAGSGSGSGAMGDAGNHSPTGAVGAAKIRKELGGGGGYKAAESAVRARGGIVIYP